MVALHSLSDNSFNPDEAFPIFKRLAEAGDSEAMSILAYMYHFGLGTPVDRATALKWFRESAESCSVSGRLGLAEYLRLGLSTSVNLPEAFELYSTLSRLSPHCQFILGCFYASGEGCEKDAYKATAMWKPLAESGDVYAQALWGVSLYEGISPFFKNLWDAFPLMKKAFDNDNWLQLPPCLAQKICRYLSDYYRSGRGVGTNTSFADELLSKADYLLSLEEDEKCPFAFLEIVSFDEARSFFTTPDLTNLDAILNKVTFDYPLVAREVEIN